MKAQKDMIKAPPKKKVTPAHKDIIAAPGAAKMVDDELTLSYIISKKPKAKKVVKYLQHMVDEIMEEAD